EYIGVWRDEYPKLPAAPSTPQTTTTHQSLRRALRSIGRSTDESDITPPESRSYRSLTPTWTTPRHLRHLSTGSHCPDSLLGPIARAHTHRTSTRSDGEPHAEPEEHSVLRDHRDDHQARQLPHHRDRRRAPLLSPPRPHHGAE